MKWRQSILVVALVLALSGVRSTPVLAASVRYVAPGGANTGNTCLSSASPCGTIAYTLTQAQDYDTISLAAGTYAENLSIIGRQLTITGPTSGAPAIVDGGNANSVFIVQASSLTLTYLTVQHGGQAVYGAGIYASGSVLTVDHCVITDNHAGLPTHTGNYIYGGGIYAASTNTTVIRYSTISLNSAIGATGADASPAGSQVGGTGGVGFGGGVYVQGGPFTVSYTTISGNTAQGGPGGGSNSFAGDAGGSYGGGIMVNGNGLNTGITTSLFADNQAIGGTGGNGEDLDYTGGTPGHGGYAYGAGLYSITTNTWNAANTTFYHNRATGGTGGDGASGAPGGSAQGGGSSIDHVSLYNTTIANNSAVGGAGGRGYIGSNGSIGTASGGGLDARYPTFLYNNIIANNLQGGNCNYASGAFAFAAYTMEWPGPTPTCGIGNQASLKDPLLTGLTTNGGPTQTMALGTGSPAIDTGYDGYCAVGTPVNGIDQRGVTRPQGPHCDIGAYEATVGPTAARITRRDVSRHGESLLVRWQMAQSREVLGFDIYAGSHRLTPHTIPMHPNPRYHATVHWHGPTAALRLHVLLRTGQVWRLLLH